MVAAVILVVDGLAFAVATAAVAAAAILVVDGLAFAVVAMVVFGTGTFSATRF